MADFISNLYKRRFMGKYFIEQYTDYDFRLIYCPLATDKVSSHKFKNYFKTTELQISSEVTSISRTKRNIRRICLSNDFEYFATWTISSKLADRFHLENCIETMKKDLKAFKRKFENFKYIYIIETHKNGAFHFHGLVKGIPETEMKEYTKTQRYTIPKYIMDSLDSGVTIYHCPFFDDKLGYNTFSKIRDYSKCCNYIIKYVSKDFVRTAENQVYFCSRGLSKGLHYEVPYIDPTLFPDDKSYAYTIDDSIFAITRDFNIKDLSQKENLIFQSIKD